MAYPTDWYETLVAAASAATASLQMPNTMVDLVFAQYSSNYAGALGQSLKINVPVVNNANATDIQNGGVVGITPDETSTQIVINHKYSSNRRIQTYDETLSAGDLGMTYVQPVIEEVLRKLDSAICAEITTANLPTNGTIVGGNDTFTRAQIASAWASLRARGVPTGNPAMCAFVTHSLVLGNMMGSAEFANESVVGINAAELTQQSARLFPQFGFNAVDDPYMPQPAAGTYAAVAFHRYFYGVRTVVPRLANSEHFKQTVVMPRKNVPVVLETWVEPKDQARYIHGFVMCGHKVVREDMAQFMVTT